MRNALTNRHRVTLSLSFIKRNVFLWLLLLGGGPVCAVKAETYVAGQAGYTLAHAATHVEVIDPGLGAIPPGTTASNLRLNDSLLYGMKVGRYLDSIPWLGVELESFITKPHIPSQHVTYDIPGTGSVAVDEPGATNRLIVVAPNLVARYRVGDVEPYLGVGPGVFILHQKQGASTSSSPFSQSSTRVGLNTQVGVRYRMTERVSVFGEWKFNYVRYHLSGQADVPSFGMNATIQLHHFVFGIGYHF